MLGMYGQDCISGICCQKHDIHLRSMTTTQYGITSCPACETVIQPIRNANKLEYEKNVQDQNSSKKSGDKL